MFVVKRDGRKEDVKFDKITSRINKLCYGLDNRFVDSVKISQKVIQGVYPGVTTIELDELAAQTSAYMSTQHPDFSKLAARISVSNLLKADGKVVERPQHMIMRVSVGIHKENIDKVIETYDLMSQRLFTHATPTLFNAGTPKPQMSSCFLLTMKEDSISGIYDTLKQAR